MEGYYGREYTHADRLWLIEHMAAWGMNVYVYAPKDDPLGRDEWRTPYGEEAMREFEQLVAHGDELGVRVGFALSPGLSIEYSSRGDVAALEQKYLAFESLGARFLCLALDDVSSELAHTADRERYASLAEAHVDLATKLCDAIDPETTLWLVPTDYAGSGHSDYLETLGAGLPARVEIAWTGRTVVSPEITRQEAAARAASVGRRLLIWDNVPVNDGPMRRVLHLAPYVGRAPELPEHISGVLLNPMEIPHASAITLRCAAAYLNDPAGYDPETTWRDAIQEMGAGAAEPLEAFALAHRFSALTPDDRDRELEAVFTAIRRGFEDGPTANEELKRPLAQMREVIERRLEAAAAVRENLRDRQLLDEIEPWLEAHHGETERIAAAVDLLESLAFDPPGLQRALAFFRMEGRLTRIPPSSHVSFGPRRAVYPQLVSLGDRSARFGADPVLLVDRSLSEEIVRFAERMALAEPTDG